MNSWYNLKLSTSLSLFTFISKKRTCQRKRAQAFVVSQKDLYNGKSKLLIRFHMTGRISQLSSFVAVIFENNCNLAFN